ncbi:uncharacterized protein FOMMEDRAFT_160542 [Fomitiporia mediterranea MF3/22]|uniref:uncharacterized protein n=1 Tax=Fomitiporia mediterranea (strain MF3/22) TaxID=694068 RepID=UPI0004409BC5|nr:uncharacterized protein FOMMEDRAFT_160542 [Fomitiporia mediterranea MF3/22]EJC99484.1 hypothetical protein FOMMEDRAFT_160542 [Fomitiporia mediterranea MF3/22]
MSKKATTPTLDEPPPLPPPSVPPQITVAKPTRQDIVHIIFLLANLTLTSHALQTLLRPIFGKTFGPLAFHAGVLFAFIAFSFSLPDNVKQQRNALVIMSMLQTAASLAGRSLGAVAAPLLIEEPTLASGLVHALLSFPTLGVGGAVWLNWTRRYMDPEPTTMGRMTVRVFTCVALTTIIKYAEPLVGDTLLQHFNIPPNATLVCLAMTTYTLSIIFRPDRSVFDVHQISKIITVLSLYMVVLAVSVPPYTPSALSVQYQRFTPYGFIQVVDNHFTTPTTRYIRLDASVLGEVVLTDDGNAGDAKGTANALLEAIMLVQGTSDKRALSIGVQTGAVAKSLISNSYNTTIVDAREHLIAAVQNYFGLQLPEPSKVITEEPAVWVRRLAGENADEKFDVIVHDVFEGGELPARLFTMELWAALGNVLDKDGVLAVNYVGKRNSVTFKSTLNMLRKNFKTCRAFRSNPVDKLPLAVPHEFNEVVILCTPAESLSFRSVSTSSDHFSMSTAAVLSSLDAREVDIKEALGETPPERFLLKEEDPVMGRWGKDGINDYWKSVSTVCLAELLRSTTVVVSPMLAVDWWTGLDEVIPASDS